MKSFLYAIVIILLLTACSAPVGVYRLNEGIVYGPAGKMKIKRDSSFVFTYRSGLLKGETTGTWEIKSDTLILNSDLKPDSLNDVGYYRYMTDEKWLYEKGKIYQLKSVNGNLEKGSCYK